MELKINIQDIGDEGLRVMRDLDAPAVAALLAESKLELLPGESFAHLDVELRRVDATVLVHGAIRGRFFIPCSRCLGPAPIDLDEQHVHLTYLPKAAWAALGDDVELDMDDLDTYTHDGEHIDLGSLLREQLVLAIPIAPRCDDACPGISVEAAAEGGAGAGWKDALQRIKKTMDN